MRKLLIILSISLAINAQNDKLFFNSGNTLIGKIKSFEEDFIRFDFEKNGQKMSKDLPLIGIDSFYCADVRKVFNAQRSFIIYSKLHKRDSIFKENMARFIANGGTGVATEEEKKKGVITKDVLWHVKRAEINHTWSIAAPFLISLPLSLIGMAVITSNPTGGAVLAGMGVLGASMTGLGLYISTHSHIVAAKTLMEK